MDNTTTFTVRLDRDTVARLRITAAIVGVSMGKLTAAALDKYLGEVAMTDEARASLAAWEESVNLEPGTLSVAK